MHSASKLVAQSLSTHWVVGRGLGIPVVEGDGSRSCFAIFDCSELSQLSFGHGLFLLEYSPYDCIVACWCRQTTHVTVEFAGVRWKEG